LARRFAGEGVREREVDPGAEPLPG
jgi:hypothetical protein